MLLVASNYPTGGVIPKTQYLFLRILFLHISYCPDGRVSTAMLLVTSSYPTGEVISKIQHHACLIKYSFQIQTYGHNAVSVMDGGLSAWEKEGGETTNITQEQKVI